MRTELQIEQGSTLFEQEADYNSLEADGPHHRQSAPRG
jgi:hypothetical protein